MKTVKVILAAFLFAAATGSAAQAATVSNFKGSVCRSKFDACSYNDASSIARFKGKNFSKSKINSAYPSITGDEFTFAVSQYKGKKPVAGTVTYTPGEGDPMIDAIVVKVGRKYTVFTDLTPGESFTYDWYAPKGKRRPKFFFFGSGLALNARQDTTVQDVPIPAVPLPAGAVLLVSGLGAFFAFRKRKAV